MHAILVGSILAVALVFVGLTFVIVANKAAREIRDRWREARRGPLERHVLAYAHGAASSLLPALGGRVGRLDRGTLEEILLDHAQRVRGIEREKLGRALDELGYVDRYLSRLSSRRWWSRARAAETLGIARAARATESLAAALADESPEVRMRAAKALAAVRGVAAIRPLVAALTEPSRWSTIRVADILTEMGPEVVDELVEAFPRLPLHARLAALDVMGRVRSLRVVPWLRDRVLDFDPDVRARACHALGAIGDPGASALLLRALADPEWPVRAMAAKALGRIRSVDAIPKLCEAMRDREWWVRSNAAQALRPMGGPGIEALVYMLDDRDPYARHQAALALEEEGFLDRKVALLAQPDGPERRGAEHVVRRFVEAARLDRLSDHRAAHPDPRVREALAEILPPGPSEGGSA